MEAMRFPLIIILPLEALTAPVAFRERTALDRLEAYLT
jgi:hypothetical protein